MLRGHFDRNQTWPELETSSRQNGIFHAESYYTGCWWRIVINDPAQRGASLWVILPACQARFTAFTDSGQDL